MSLKTRILVGMLATSAALVSLPSLARVYVVEVAPPPPRVEVVPAPRVGYVWAPGYWGWRGHRHVWVNGNWVRERRGYHWEPHHWVERNGRWHFEEGRWHR
ncbi:MAG: YXWGXW repeat-containing protein [Pseudomonadota bacterium]|nr:YXWGXW repeat-containing protein [Pseudomonadota bacterium]